MKIKLSIAIPTYNRHKLLQETLESILSQDRDGIEVVVCDNASPDATQHLVESYKEKFRRLTYFRWPENNGFDRNILKVVEVASGDYCWLLGDDDHLEPGALDHLLPLLDGRYSVVYLNAMTYDSTMSRASGTTLSWFDCDDPDQTLLSLASWLTFVSSLCVRREDFLQHLESGVQHVGTGFAHCYPVLHLIKDGATNIVRKPLVRFRAGNTGGYNIFRMFIDEFNRIMKYCAEIGFSADTIIRVKTRNVYLVIIPAILQIKLGRLNLTADHVGSYLVGSGLRWREQLLLVGLVCCPSWIMRVIQRLKKIFRR